MTVVAVQASTLFYKCWGLHGLCQNGLKPFASGLAQAPEGLFRYDRHVLVLAQFVVWCGIVLQRSIV